jgi:hypothetical protein
MMLRSVISTSFRKYIMYWLAAALSPAAFPLATVIVALDDGRSTNIPLLHRISASASGMAYVRAALVEISLTRP